MGWTVYRATHSKNGKVDRKAECDELYGDAVVKSAMVGCIYYAAIRLKSGGIGCAVVKTSAEGSDFGYKDMDETMGPYYYDCPKGILDLLTETDNDTALEWRRKCKENLANKKSRQSEKAGTVYEIVSDYTLRWSSGFVIQEGETFRVRKVKYPYYKQAIYLVESKDGHLTQYKLKANVMNNFKNKKVIKYGNGEN